MTDTQLPTDLQASVAKRLAGMNRKRRVEIIASVLSILALAALWQILSISFPTREAQLGVTSSPVVPGWDWIFTHALPGIAAYGGDGAGAVATHSAVQGSYAGAFQALIQNTLVTWSRLLVGFVLGTVFGIGGAMAIAWSRTARLFLALPAHVLRTLPVLAMIPLVQVWFGVSFAGMVAFVAYGIAVILFAGTLNAIGNVPKRYLESAQSLGASPLRIYRTVVMPAIFPELRSSLVLCLALAWSVVVGAEFLGAQSGLGYIEVEAYQFALLDRMFVVALCFLIYAALSYLAFKWLTKPLVNWMPARRSQ